MPVPPALEQGEILKRVDSLLEITGVIEGRVVEATIRAEKLAQAILAKAFRGDLVPTEADLARAEGLPYEPASALLARIRTAQAMGEPTGGRANGRRNMHIRKRGV